MALKKKQQNKVNILRAMDEIILSANNEDHIMLWLSLGIADGDSENFTDEEFYEYYCEDEELYADIINLFCRMIPKVIADGGIYDGDNVFDGK